MSVSPEPFFLYFSLLLILLVKAFHKEKMERILLAGITVKGQFK
jgi:hypothetical protein